VLRDYDDPSVETVSHFSVNLRILLRGQIPGEVSEILYRTLYNNPFLIKRSEILWVDDEMDLIKPHIMFLQGERI